VQFGGFVVFDVLPFLLFLVGAVFVVFDVLPFLLFLMFCRFCCF
jgi:hypothetical protein